MSLTTNFFFLYLQLKYSDQKEKRKRKSRNLFGSLDLCIAPGKEEFQHQIKSKSCGLRNTILFLSEALLITRRINLTLLIFQSYVILIFAETLKSLQPEKKT